MQLQFEKRELACLTQAVRSVKEQELIQEIRLSDSLPDVGRVLAGWGQVILRGKEWQADQLGVSGGVMAWLLYAPEDGTEPRTVNTWLPFQMKWEGVQADREGPMRVCALLRFVDGRNVSARKILVRAGVSCLTEALFRRTAEFYSPAEVPEDVELLRRSYPVRLPREAGEKTFTLEEALEAVTPPVAELLSYTLTPELTETRVTGDKVVLRGCGNLHLVYRCPEGRIRTRNFEVPFSQFAELEREYEQDPQADVMMAVTGLELDLEEERLALKCSLVGQYLVSDRTVLELVEDAYSTRRDVGIRQEELNLPLILDERSERITAQSVIPDVDGEAADLSFWCGFPQQRREGDGILLEIPGRFQLLSCGADGTLHTAWSRWESQTRLGADEGTRIDAVTLPAAQVQWSGMEARSTIQLRATAVSKQGMPMITGLELGETRSPDENRPSLILCRPGSRDLWSIAKGTSSSVSAIRSANGLSEDPADNRMLLIPIP